MNIHVFQHAHFEGPGSIAAWAKERGHSLTFTRFFADETPPSIDDIDALVVLGGPMGVYDDHAHPWIR